MGYAGAMADKEPTPSGLLELGGGLAGGALKSFFGTLARMVALGFVAGGCTAWYLGGGPVWATLVGAASALCVFSGGGVFLGGQRAAGTALLGAVRRAALGSRAVGLVFDTLDGTWGEAVAGRVPLDRAEDHLRATVSRLVSASEAGGGLRGRLRRAIERKLLGSVESLTLSAFRDEDRGGVDLKKVRDAVAARADEALADRIEGALLRVTVLVVLGAGLLQGVVVYLLTRAVTPA